MVHCVTYITLRYVALIQVDFIYPEKTLISRRQQCQKARRVP